jgi:alkanesulfonate monooxygenase SsuD/methylene tetrahydromethanopterin reductase-like flavin-dependent oxidoreductase (luciferase family)
MTSSTQLSLGVVFRPEYPPERLRAVAEVADASGLQQLWLWEDCFRQSGISAAAAALAWTTQLRVGIGLLPVPLRNVALTAMEIATLSRLFPGRVEVGVGHGVQSWMAQVGARVESPLTLLREHLAALRALLAGERVTTNGRYVHLDGVALDWPPEVPPRLFAGAIGPRSLALAGELADGTILTSDLSPAGLRTACDRVAEARSAAGRTDPHEVVVYLGAATGTGAAARLSDDLQTFSAKPGEEVGVAGDAPAVAAAVRRWADAGASAVVLQPTADEPDIEGFVQFAAQGVQPLLA